MSADTPKVTPVEAELVRAVSVAAADALRSGMPVGHVCGLLMGCAYGIQHAQDTVPDLIAELSQRREDA